MNETKNLEGRGKTKYTKHFYKNSIKIYEKFLNVPIKKY